MDLLFIILRPTHLCVYLILLVCMVWDLDGPFWFLEDIGTHPFYRSLPEILCFQLIRFIFLIFGFLETGRTVHYSVVAYISVLISIRELIQVLQLKVSRSHCLFEYYTELQIISAVLAEGMGKASFLLVTAAYYLFIQTNWLCICGFGELDATVYSFFATVATIIVVGTAVVLPLVANIGENILELPKIKRGAMKRRYIGFKSLKNLISVKKAAALNAVKFSYGCFYPFCKSFSRNVFDNALQTLLSMVLLFDLNGRRHK